ncbi:MAG: hypothetical protein M1457_06135 [bacterium]|nr:hypothetical protein [bacterium]
MKKTLLLALALGFVLGGCCRLPVCTREIYFYRTADLNQGRPVAIDIIYPKDAAEKNKIVSEIGYQKWFTSELYDRVHKDKVWLDNAVIDKKLVNKQKADPYMIIFVEYGSTQAAPERGREPFLVFEKATKPKGRKVEYIRVYNGSLQRLRSKPKSAQ